jgi:UDP-N-acetyl-D-mannosaminuronic acid dehydrogenase
VNSNIRNIVIVGGCGHVGLPLGIVLADKGAHVALLDTDRHKVEQVNSGEMPFRETGADILLRQVIGKSLHATLDLACLGDADADHRGWHACRRSSEPHCQRTLPQHRPGTSSHARWCHARAAQHSVPGRDQTCSRTHSVPASKYSLAFCPERIAEGKALDELVKLPQIVAAFDPVAFKRARELFQIFAPSIVELSPLEAELAKLFTNSWRYLNFAVSNQFYILARAYGLDFYRIHEAITRDYPRMSAFARAGFAAGPCLLKDTLQLAAFANNNFFLGHAAMLVNEGLPNVIVEELRRKGLHEQRVGILGMAFKGDSDDKRESLAYKLRNLVVVYAKEVLCTDPYIADPSFVSLETVLDRADVIILGAPHSVYRDLRLPPDKQVVDIWNFWRNSESVKLGGVSIATAQCG